MVSLSLSLLGSVQAASGYLPSSSTRIFSRQSSTNPNIPASLVDR